MCWGYLAPKAQSRAVNFKQQSCENHGLWDFAWRSYITMRLFYQAESVYKPMTDDTEKNSWALRRFIHQVSRNQHRSSVKKDGDTVFNGWVALFWKNNESEGIGE
jgi:hypothetical protein